VSASAVRLLSFALLWSTAGCGLLAPEVPPPPSAERSITLDQAWTPDQAARFHHLTQGTSTFGIPYTWLISLEQPRLSLSEVPLFIEPEYLSRFGFIPSPTSPQNPDGLPIGFARDPEAVDPISGETRDIVGFTCAACHTGRITYRGASMIIEGGAAMIDTGKFRASLGLALAYTYYVPGRLARFSARVLGAEAAASDREALSGALSQLLSDSRTAREEAGVRTEDSVAEGFGRLDAIGRIANTVFARRFDARNYRPLRAPVAYPHVWDAAWFDWVQYNGSIRQPMVRNSGEALGVTALVNLVGPESELYRSNVRVENLYALEEQLAGSSPWQGLRAPGWPEEVLGSIDRELAQEGRKLYTELCQSCHLPPVDSQEMRELREPYFTSPDDYGRQYLRVRMVDLEAVGTDPRHAQLMRSREVDLARLGSAKDSTTPDVAAPARIVAFAPALADVTERVVERWYDENEISESDRVRMNGYRPNDIRAPLQYKARPLNGIWATPPYLHNGSIPDLYSLLLPVNERPVRFWLGSIEFDPARVGYVTRAIDGGFELDTTQPGNSNAGHEFSDGPVGEGRVGRGLADRERWALIEFLKTQ